MEDVAPATTAPSGPWLPKGPYRLDPRYGRRSLRAGWVMRGLALAFLALGVLYLVDEVPPLQRDAALWSAPDAVEGRAEFEGEVKSHFGVLSSYRGTVRYLGPDSTLREGEVEFTTLVEIDTDADALVRFRKEDPDTFALNWAAENAGSRWGVVALIGAVVALLLPGLCWFVGRGALRKYRLVGALAEQGGEATAPIMDVEEQRQYGKVVSRRVLVDLDGPGGPQRVVEAMRPKEGEPLVLPPGDALVLVSPLRPGEGVVLRHDLWPLELPAAERDAVLAKVAAAQQAADGAG